MKHLLSYCFILFFFSFCQIELISPSEFISTDTSLRAKTVTLSGRITQSVRLRAIDTNIIYGTVYIANNSTLTIEAGTIIYAQTGSNIGTLVITRGAKIIADGTANQPIVFTSNKPVNERRRGDWGGIIICGISSVNTSFISKGKSIKGLFQVEGGIDNAYGDGIAGAGDDLFPAMNSNDNSGILRYVRIEYPGYAFQPDKEINGLTLAAVGSGTTLDHIEVAFSNDDAFEWFGGTVNANYLIAYKTLDDDFDVDNGYNGTIQFGIALRDSNIADVSKSEAIEADNNAGGTEVTPQTSVLFSNMTLIGPMAKSNNKGNSLFLAGVQIRRNAKISLINSLILGWPIGIFLDASTGIPVNLNYSNNSMDIKNLILAGNRNDLFFKPPNSLETNFTLDSFYKKFDQLSQGNIRLLTIESSKISAPFNYTNFNPIPNNNSQISSANLISGNLTFLDYSNNGYHSNNSFNGITVTSFRGAVGLNGQYSTWWQDGNWAKWNY